MTAITPKATNHAGLGPQDSRFVRVAELPWDKAMFEGIEFKTLVMDREQGLMTVLMRMAPGARLPDHEHVLLEQTYVLEGRLVDRDGECGPGEFVYRPPGSRHEAWAPEGGLMLAIFQMPNKFYMQDGRVLDFVGGDWMEKWGAARPAVA